MGCWCGKVLLAPWNSSQRTFQGVPHFGKRCPLSTSVSFLTTPRCFCAKVRLLGTPPRALDLTSSSEQGTQCPFSKGFNVQERFIPNAHGNHLLHSELWGTETLFVTSLGHPPLMSVQPRSLSGLLPNTHTSFFWYLPPFLTTKVWIVIVTFHLF